MSEEVHIETTVKTAEERHINLERAKVGLESDRLNLAKIVISLDVDELTKQKAEADLNRVLLDLNVKELKEGHVMLNAGVARLSGVVDTDSVAEARTQLYHLSNTMPGEPLMLDINSPGGSVTDGMELFGIVRELSKAGHFMTTRISGEAASMGGVIAQAGDNRQIREGSYLHLHEASWGSMGKASTMTEAAEHVEMITRDISKIYARKAKWSADKIYDRIHRREWYMGAEEALELSFVDEIV